MGCLLMVVKRGTLPTEVVVLASNVRLRHVVEYAIAPVISYTVASTVVLESVAFFVFTTCSKYLKKN